MLLNKVFMPLRFLLGAVVLLFIKLCILIVDMIAWGVVQFSIMWLLGLFGVEFMDAKEPNEIVFIPLGLLCLYAAYRTHRFISPKISNSSAYKGISHFFRGDEYNGSILRDIYNLLFDSFYFKFFAVAIIAVALMVGLIVAGVKEGHLFTVIGFVIAISGLIIKGMIYWWENR